jgi:AP endonuclease-1
MPESNWKYAFSFGQPILVHAHDGFQTLEDKKEWNQHFENYIRDLDKVKPVIWTGDLNVAPTERGNYILSYFWTCIWYSVTDLTNAKKNWNKTAGYTEAETTSFKNILNPPEDVDAAKFVDVWRQMHPNDQHYTYFSYRFNCRLKGIGWRLDMCEFSLSLIHAIWSESDCDFIVVLSERIAERVKMVSFFWAAFVYLC